MAAARHGGMDEDDRFAPVQFVEYGCELFVAEQFTAVIAGQKPDSVQLQYVKRMLDLAQTPVYIRQRQGGKHSEAPGEILDQLRSVFVAFARISAPLCICSDPIRGTCS